ncbi:hypothetical protein T484DRAFT_2017549, partial [Baffinella frigidus]
GSTRDVIPGLDAASCSCTQRGPRELGRCVRRNAASVAPSLSVAAGAVRGPACFGPEEDEPQTPGGLHDAAAAAQEAVARCGDETRRGPVPSHEQRRRGRLAGAGRAASPERHLRGRERRGGGAGADHVRAQASRGAPGRLRGARADVQPPAALAPFLPLRCKEASGERGVCSHQPSR